MPASAMASSTGELSGSSVLVDGRVFTAAPVGAAVGATVGAAATGEAVGAADGAGVAVGAGAAAHVDLVMVFVSKVTAPFRASARPSIVAPVVTVIDDRAMIVPLNADPVPIVAELPICQKTLQDCAPPMRTTLLPEAVVSVEPAWKIQTSLGPPESVSAPVSPIELAELYTPGTKVWPPRLPAIGIVGPLPAAVL